MTTLSKIGLMLALMSAQLSHAQSMPGPQKEAMQPSAAPTLPDAPLATASAVEPQTHTVVRPEPRVMNWTYWTVNGALVGATLANAQAIYNCPNCTFVPSSFHRAGLLYGAGLPADVLVMYLGYHLKKNGHRWWPAPAGALTAASAYLAYHFVSKTN